MSFDISLYKKKFASSVADKLNCDFSPNIEYL